MLILLIRQWIDVSGYNVQTAQTQNGKLTVLVKLTISMYNKKAHRPAVITLQFAPASFQSLTFDLFRNFPSVHMLASMVARAHDVLVQLMGEHADLLERDGVDVGERLLTDLSTAADQWRHRVRCHAVDHPQILGTHSQHPSGQTIAFTYVFLVYLYKTSGASKI